MTEAERQAARYEEDPDGVLRWFMEHPAEAKDWETLFFQDIASKQRRSLIFRVRLAIVSLIAAVIAALVVGFKVIR